MAQPGLFVTSNRTIIDCTNDSNQQSYDYNETLYNQERLSKSPRNTKTDFSESYSDLDSEVGARINVIRWLESLPANSMFTDIENNELGTLVVDQDYQNYETPCCSTMPQEKSSRKRSIARDDNDPLTKRMRKSTQKVLKNQNQGKNNGRVARSGTRRATVCKRKRMERRDNLSNNNNNNVVEEYCSLDLPSRNERSVPKTRFVFTNNQSSGRRVSGLKNVSIELEKMACRSSKQTGTEVISITDSVPVLVKKNSSRLFRSNNKLTRGDSNNKMLTSKNEKPVFSNPYIERCLNQAMRKTIDKFKSSSEAWEQSKRPSTSYHQVKKRQKFSTNGPS